MAEEKKGKIFILLALLLLIGIPLIKAKKAPGETEIMHTKFERVNGL